MFKIFQIKNYLRSENFLASLLTLIAISTIFLDQVSKTDVESMLLTWNHASEIENYTAANRPLFTAGFAGDEKSFGHYISFSLSYARNVGGAWGVLSNLPNSIRSSFFYVVTMMAFLFVLNFIRITPTNHYLARYALFLILAGAAGNIIDRIKLGYVIDWIGVDWKLFSWHYQFPRFNIADSAITIGILLVIIDLLVFEPKRKQRLAE